MLTQKTRIQCNARSAIIGLNARPIDDRVRGNANRPNCSPQPIRSTQSGEWVDPDISKRVVSTVDIWKVEGAADVR